MQWYTCKSLLNTLGRAVEQLAGALPLSSTQASKSALEVEVQKSCTASAQGYEYRILPVVRSKVRIPAIDNDPKDSEVLQKKSHGYSC